MSGAKTNIITYLEVTKSTMFDGHMYKPIVQETSKHFNMKEVSADKAYLSRKNLEFTAKLGAVPFIPFKKNSHGMNGGVWNKMLCLFRDHQEEFMKKYHLRSNAETVFAMMKRKFSPMLRTLNETSQNNEILCMALCHNLCVLIQEYFELGAKIDFIYCAEQIATNR